jgi:ATP-dependent Clp protease protease subunit
MNRRPRGRSKGDDENACVLDKNLSTIYLSGEITQRVASTFRQHLRTLERLKRHPAILVEINSPGGDIEGGLMIVDSIELCSKPVTTRVCGQAMSMAFVILACGTKREALPNAMIMSHQGTYNFNPRFDEIDIEVSYAKKLEDICNEILDRKTGREPGYWSRRHGGRNLYLNAAQAVEERVVDLIVTREK